MKLLVTGCCGFIGSHLCERLLKEKHIVYGIDIINNYYSIEQKFKNLQILQKYKNFTFKLENICDTKIIDEIKPDIVINIAAMAGVRYSLENPKIYMKTNIEGQINLLKQSVENNVKLFIYASSSSVYGTNKKVPFSEEDDILNLNSPYAASKRSAELMAELYNKLYNLNVIGLRFFTVYGPRGRPDMAPFKFLSKIMNCETIDKYGDGTTYRDYTYVDDIVDGIMGSIINKNNRSCEVYNLGNSTPHSLNEFIKCCEKVTGKKAIINQMEDQLGDVPKTYADITKAKNDLDYSPKIKLDDGLKKMYEWLLTR